MKISDDVSFEGFIEGKQEPVECIVLRTLHGGNNLESSSNCIAYIYWRSVDDQGPEADFGESVILMEQDEQVCICWMPMNTKIGLEDNLALWSEYDTVEQGILDGEYEIEMLADKDAVLLS